MLTVEYLKDFGDNKKGSVGLLAPRPFLRLLKQKIVKRVHKETKPVEVKKPKAKKDAN